jgi:hypothetical protein
VTERRSATEDAVPFGIDRARHCELAGRSRHVWLRRAFLLLVAALPVLGLCNVFGQASETTSFTSAAATIVVTSPVHYRGGLLFTTEIVITPHTHVKDAKLRLGNGWFENMSVNAVTPQPSEQTASGSWQIWDFGPRPADVPVHVWIAWQTNATNVGRHTEPIALYDGPTPLVTGTRTVTVFP